MQNLAKNAKFLAKNCQKSGFFSKWAQQTNFRPRFLDLAFNLGIGTAKTSTEIVSSLYYNDPDIPYRDPGYFVQLGPVHGSGCSDPPHSESDISYL